MRLGAVNASRSSFKFSFTEGAGAVASVLSSASTSPDVPLAHQVAADTEMVWRKHYQLRRKFASATLAQQRDARPGRDAPAAGSAAVCGHTYQLPPGQSAQTFFTGSRHFQAAEVEVYQVQLQ